MEILAIVIPSIILAIGYTIGAKYLKRSYVVRSVFKWVTFGVIGITVLIIIASRFLLK